MDSIQVLNELDELLKIETPSNNHIEKLKELLKYPITEKYFFQKLESPNWLNKLEEINIFSNPPGKIKDGNLVYFSYWPLSKYLIKIAENKPREVMDIIKELQKTNNTRIQEDFIECALKMPISIAIEIVPLSMNWNRTLEHSLIPEKLGNLTIKLIEDSEVELALELIASLLDIEVKNQTSRFQLKDISEIHQYRGILEDVVPSLFETIPENVIDLLCQKLTKFIELERARPTDNEYDGSYSWRPAIEDHPQNRIAYDDIKNLLVSYIRDYLEDLGKQDELHFLSSYNLLSKYTFKVYRRIELHLMRQFPNLLQTEIHKIFSKKQFLLDFQLRYEYYHLPCFDPPQ